MKRRTSFVLVVAFTVIVISIQVRLARAHCDTVDGPVAADVRGAIADGDPTAILKWVSAADEPAVRNAFAHTLEVRALGDAGRELADRWLLETVIRIHRAGEGASYTGLKPAGSIEPAIVLADEALAAGSADDLIGTLSGHVARVLQERFDRALARRAHAADNIAAGRAYVAAYVELMHTIEGLEGALGGDHDGHAPAAVDGGQVHEEHRHSGGESAG